MTTDSDVCVGAGRADGDGTVLYDVEGSEMDDARGLMGVTGSECWWYQASTDGVSTSI